MLFVSRSNIEKLNAGVAVRILSIQLLKSFNRTAVTLHRLKLFLNIIECSFTELLVMLLEIFIVIESL